VAHPITTLDRRAWHSDSAAALCRERLERLRRRLDPLEGCVLDHGKAAVRRFASDAGWVLVGSHNLSSAAWGAPYRRWLRLRNYELSVLVLNPPGSLLDGFWSALSARVLPRLAPWSPEEVEEAVSLRLNASPLWPSLTPVEEATALCWAFPFDFVGKHYGLRRPAAAPAMVTGKGAKGKGMDATVQDKGKGAKGKGAKGKGAKGKDAKGKGRRAKGRGTVAEGDKSTTGKGASAEGTSAEGTSAKGKGTGDVGTEPPRARGRSSGKDAKGKKGKGR